MTIPNSVTSIGNGAFSGCSGLASIKVGSGNTKYNSRNNCNAIIETASNTLIAGCKNTIIPNSVTSIGERAFYYCRSLTSVTIPNSVKSIGTYAFWGCSGLTSVTIPNSVTSIGGSAFLLCSSLTSVTIPNSVKSIGNGAFRGCIGLTSIKSEIESPFETGSSCFNYVNKDIPLYVPIGSKEAYAYTACWNEFANIIEWGGELAITKSEAGNWKEKELLPIELTDMADFVSIQFDIVLPEGIGISTDDAVTTERTANLKQSVKSVEGNTYRVLLYSNNNAVIAGDEGAIANLPMLLKSKEVGNYEVTVKGIVMTYLNDKKQPVEQSQPDFTAQITVLDKYVRGDANNNGTVNIADVSEIAAFIFNRQSDNYNGVLADANGDGRVNVVDIIEIINIINGTSSSAKRFAPSSTVADDELSLAKADSRSFSMNLKNSTPFAGFQFDVEAPSAQDLTITANNSRLSTSDFMADKIDDGLYRVLYYTDGSPISAADGIILTVSSSSDLSGTYTVKDIHFATTDAKDVEFSTLTYDSSATGINCVANDSQEAVWYTLEGVRMQGSPKSGGVYIKNNKKVVVK